MNNDYDDYSVLLYDSVNEMGINLDKLNLSKKTVIHIKFVRHEIAFEDKLHMTWLKSKTHQPLIRVNAWSS